MSALSSQIDQYRKKIVLHIPAVPSLGGSGVCPHPVAVAGGKP